MMTFPSQRVFRGASAGAAGTRGRVPLPAAGDQGKVLNGAALWQNPPISGETQKGNWNATTNTPTLADGGGAAGDTYYVETGGTRNLGSGSQTFERGDYVFNTGTLWQKRTQPERVDSVSLAGISSAGNSDFTIASGIRNSSCSVAISAGSAAYLATISLLATNAIAGAMAVFQIAMPASLNPVIEVRNLTGAGTLLGTLYGHPTLARTWIVRVRFDGTNWTAAGVELANRRSAPVVDVQEWLSTRRLSDLLYFDGATTSSRAYIPLGTAGDGIGAGKLTVPLLFQVPAVASVGNYGLWFIGIGNASYGGGSYSFAAYIDSSGNLCVGITSPNGTNQRRLHLGVFRANYSAQWLWLHVTWDGASAPVVYINGVPQTMTETTNGTPPAWSQAVDDDFFTLGLHSSTDRFAGPLVPFAPINRVWTAAEVLYQVQTGRMPASDELGTGSMVNRLNTNSSTFATNAVDSNAFNTAYTGYWGVTPANTTAVVSSGVLTITRVSGTAGLFSGATINTGNKAYRKYRLIFNVTSKNGTWEVWESGSGTVKYTVNTGLNVIDFTAQDGTFRLYSNSGTDLTIDATSQPFLVLDLGPIAKPKMQPGAIVHSDSGANSAALVTTPGVTAIGEKPETISLQGPAITSDNFVHLDQVITPTGYKLAEAYVAQTGVATSTITVKETSSGGTTVATGALSASTPRVELTVSNGLLAGGKKLHLANTSWGGNAVTPFFVFRRCQ